MSKTNALYMDALDSIREAYYDNDIDASEFVHELEALHVPQDEIYEMVNTIEADRIADHGDWLHEQQKEPRDAK